MKITSFLALASVVALAGCGSSDDPYRLVIENATIASGPSTIASGPSTTSTSTTPAATWCKDGSAPAITVIARTKYQSGTTTAAAATLNPIWDEGVLVARASAFDRGIRVDVNGQCPEGTVHIGAARVYPGSGVYSGRALVVNGLGGATQLRLRWEPLREVTGGSDAVYFDGGYYVDDSVGYYDTSGDYVWTDPSTDTTDTPPDDSATCDATTDTCDDTSTPPDTSSTDTSSTDTSSSDTTTDPSSSDPPP